jgi:rod shape-determining protein MreD
VRNSAFLAAGVLLLVVQSNLHRLAALLPFPWLMPSLTLPLILFMGVHEYSVVRGAALAFVLGYATDLFAGAPVGLFTFTSVSVFLLSRAAGVRLAAQTKLTQVALAFAFALVEGITVVVLLAIFREAAASYSARALLPVIAPHAAATAVVSPFVFALAERLHQATIGLARPDGGPPL